MFKRPRITYDYAIISDSASISKDVVLKGEVNIGSHVIIQACSVLNAHNNIILIGNNVFIGDSCLIESKGHNRQTFICNNVEIESRVRLRNVTIEEDVKILEGAVLMDNVFISAKAIIGQNTIIAPDSIVLEGVICEPNCIYAGVPAKKVDALPKNSSLKNLVKRISKGTS